MHVYRSSPSSGNPGRGMGSDDADDTDDAADARIAVR
jgi:hypothetical protein